MAAYHWLLMAVLGGLPAGQAAAPAGSPPREFLCGAERIAVTVEGQTLRLSAAGATYVLRQTPVASGARYEAEGDPSTSFWSRGDVASLRLRGRGYPECVAAAGTPSADAGSFQATGHEPGWRLDIRAGQLTLLTDYGQNKISVPAPYAEAIAGGRRYIASSAGRPIVATILDRPCGDSATGLPRPFSVSVEFAGQTLRGCGGETAALLGGEPWVVQEINGAALVRGSRASLRRRRPGGRVGLVQQLLGDLHRGRRGRDVRPGDGHAQGLRAGGDEAGGGISRRTRRRRAPRGDRRRRAGAPRGERPAHHRAPGVGRRRQRSIPRSASMRALVCGLAGLATGALLTSTVFVAQQRLADDETRQAVTAVKRAIVEGHRTRDAKGLSALYADDYLAIDSTGAVRTKADLLNALPTDPEMSDGRYDLVAVRRWGNLAVASGRGHLVYRNPDGSSRVSDYYSFNVFERRDGKWLYVSAFLP